MATCCSNPIAWVRNNCTALGELVTQLQAGLIGKLNAAGNAAPRLHARSSQSIDMADATTTTSYATELAAFKTANPLPTGGSYEVTFNGIDSLAADTQIADQGIDLTGELVHHASVPAGESHAILMLFEVWS